MNKLRVGILGSGIGRSHAEGFAALPEHYDIAAIADVSPDRRDDVASQFGIPNRLDSLDELLLQDLDVISICTPSALHFEQAVAAMEAGINVVIEKPAASSLAEVDALIETSARTGMKACPVFQYRYGHGLQKLLHLIDKGMAGAPSIATAETHWSRAGEYYSATDWRGTWDGETGGCFTTHAVHIHDILCKVLGTPKSVFARTSNRLNGNQTEDMGAVNIEFENGAIASSSVTLGSRQQTSRLRFCFENLVAESGLDPYQPANDPWAFPNDDAKCAAEIENALADFSPQPEHFAGQFLRMHNALTQGTELPVTLADSRRSLELLTAIYWSARSKETVNLPICLDHPFYTGWVDTMKKDILDG